MKHYLNVCDVHGDKIEPVDLICFGSPCQDLSIAGKRGGLKHESNGDDETTRSGLFMEAVRIIEEMRDATRGRYPTFALWENVPGALSSNGGEDFRTVLLSLARISDKTVSIPRPNGKWLQAGYIRGKDWSIAWRIVDAQHFGVPQRRRRILLVADFASQCANEISFVSESLQRDSSQERKEREETSRNIENCIRANDSILLGDLYNGTVGRVSKTLNSSASDSDHVPVVLDARGNRDGKNCSITGDHENRITDFTTLAVFRKAGNPMNKEQAQGYEETDKNDTLNLFDNSETRTPTVIVQESIPYTMKIRSGVEFDKNGKKAGKGALVQEDISGCLNCSQDQYLFQPVNWDGTQKTGTLTKCNANGSQRMPDKDNFNGIIEAYIPKISETIDGHYYLGQGSRGNKERQYVAYGLDRASYNQGANAQFDFSVLEEQQPTLTAKGPGAYGTRAFARFIVRRLTPTECSRLQGFPDWWGMIEPKQDMTDEEVIFWNDVYTTHQKIVMGKDAKPKTKEQLIRWYNGLWNDGSEYKMWGNGVALPCVRDPIHNMAKRGIKTMGSLFDGSGGFPLASVLEGIEPRWASEIEPYPIAVTTSRFKGD